MTRLHVFENRTRIFDLPVDRCSPLEFEMFLERALRSDHIQRIVTLNPEIALAAHRNPRYGNMIRTADFVTMDGMGLMLALWLLGRGRRPRIIGSSVLRSMCGLAERTDAAVAFLLRDDGLATPPLLRGALRNHWPKLNAAIGTISAPSAPDEALIRAVNDHAPAMLVMNIGGPAQEEWITSYVDLFPSVRIVVGVGGAIDYLAGSVPTPPALVRRLGFEWAWRLVRQPRRFRRIFNATIIFPFFVLTDALNAPARRIFLRFRSA